jgi:hypothetical protein
MAVQFKCRGCEEVLKAPDAARGKVMTCKGCGTKNKIPEGKARAKSAAKGTKGPRKPPPKPAGDVDLFAGDLSGEDTRYIVCQQCGEQFMDPGEEAEETTCPYCGFDYRSGTYTKEAKRGRIKARGKVDTTEFFDTAKGESLEFGKRHLSLAAKSGLYVMVPSLLGLWFAYLVVYNGKQPPKVFFGFLAAVFALMPIGWLMSLTYQTIEVTLAGKDVIKRPVYDMFQCAANGVTFFALQVAYLLPAMLAMIGAYLYGEDQHELGLGLICLGPVLMLPVYPVILAHLAMPVSWPAWVFTKAMQLWVNVVGASFYWVAFTLLALLPGLIGLGVAGGLFAEDVQAVMADVDYNAKLGYEKYLASRGEGEEPAGEYREPAYDLLIPPAVITLVSLYLVGLVWIYPARINGHMAYYFLKDLELIQEKAETKYVARERYVDEDGILRIKGAGDKGTGWIFAVIMVGIIVLNACYYFATGNVLLPESMVEDVDGAARFGRLLFVLAVGIEVCARIGVIGAAFQEGAVWGLCVILIPVGSLIFICTHWQQAKSWVAMLVVAGITAGVAAAMGGFPEPQA